MATCDSISMSILCIMIKNIGFSNSRILYWDSNQELSVWNPSLLPITLQWVYFSIFTGLFLRVLTVHVNLYLHDLSTVKRLFCMRKISNLVFMILCRFIIFRDTEVIFIYWLICFLFFMIHLLVIKAVGTVQKSSKKEKHGYSMRK